MVVVLASTYLQGVGFNLESQTGVPRGRMHAMYAYAATVRPFCWLAMLFLSGWVSVMASILAMFCFTLCAARVTREHARLILQQFSENSYESDDETRRCLSCGRVWPISYFGLDRSAPDSLRQICVGCIHSHQA